VGDAGRIALVTGAARGIGRAISKVLAEARTRVALADRDVAVNHTAGVLRMAYGQPADPFGLIEDPI
jgi:NAD(P)-dependent dehydrogenase (short-subunit alcohol dehydrogenase family)